MNEVDEIIKIWDLKLNIDPDLCDIALLKIYIKFENYFEKAFYWYSCGRKSFVCDYTPERKLNFIDESHLSKFLKSISNREYFDVFKRIEDISEHIFTDNKDPFGIIFQTSNYKKTRVQLTSIRNYIVHESETSRKKFIKECFNNNESEFVEPCTYLKSNKKGTKISNYTYFIQKIHEMSNILDDPRFYF